MVGVQVPCRPPGNIQAKVLDASGSYIRFVLLQVQPHAHVLLFLCLGLDRGIAVLHTQ